MSVGTICTHNVTTVDPGLDVASAAAIMRENHVGYLVATEPFLGLRTPIGVLTDRDIVVKVIARGVDPRAVTVRDTMTPDPLVAQETADVAATLTRMRGLGVRRVPVVGKDGALVGVLALDDVIDHMARDFMNMAGSIRNEQRFEQDSRR
jgi:CBS domain-containing protein